LTGRYPGNAGIRSILLGYRTTPGLTQDVPTLASALQDEGYRTELVGKWHLGMVPESRPEAHGFDNSFGCLAGNNDYYSHIHYSPNNRRAVIRGKTFLGTPLHDLWQDGEEVYRDGEYMTEMIGARAVDAVRRSAIEDDPFFLYVPFTAPHFPMHAPQKYKDRFAHLPWEKMIMAAMISAMDDAVGTVLNELDEQGLRENTIVFFMSDNGPSREIRNWLDGTQETYYGGSSGNLKGHKFSLFDGGIRVPGLISWPARIPAGQVIDEPLVAMDVFPTLLRAAGGDPADFDLDGRDIWDVITQGAASPHEYLFWEQGDQTAVRQGAWKLVLNGQLEESCDPVDEVFLSNLDDDPTESENLATDHPAVVEQLRRAVETWRRGIEDRWKNEWLPGIPDYDAYFFPANASK
jgi:arylsulfatase A-like enzyme